MARILLHTDFWHFSLGFDMHSQVFGEKGSGPQMPQYTFSSLQGARLTFLTMLDARHGRSEYM